MSTDDSGKRFSLVYLTTDEALQDSKRARARIFWLLSKYGLNGPKLADAIHGELGVRVNYAGGGAYHVDSFIGKCALATFST